MYQWFIVLFEVFYRYEKNVMKRMNFVWEKLYIKKKQVYNFKSFMDLYLQILS